MRVTYNRELTIKEGLDKQGIENFLPMKYVFIDKEGNTKREKVPALHNLIFIHASQNIIDDLKRYNQFKPLRYIPNRIRPESGEHYLLVPDKQMEQFMKVALADDSRVMFLDYNEEFFAKPGQKVEVCEGPFKGVEGKIKRIKKNRHVVVEIEGVAAVAIAYVPTQFLKIVT